VPKDTDPVHGFLLSRHWRDREDGVTLSFWAWTQLGPLKLIVPRHQPVCFIDRQTDLRLPVGANRKSLPLKSTNGRDVDALYFNAQRDLTQLQSLKAPVHEADIKPPDRFLMERFVYGGFTASGTVEQHANYRQIKQPVLKPIDVQPNFVLASVDIETRGLSDQLYSIALHSGDTSVVYMVGSAPKDNSRESFDDFDLYYFDTEKSLLHAFLLLIEKVDPDIIIGWNVVGFDLDFIQRKCEQLNMAFTLGRAGEKAAIIQIGGGSVKFARVPGRAVLDGVEMLRAAFWSFESFSLEAVGQELLGRGKTIGPSDKVAQINDLYQNNKPELARYNIEDCRLVTEIFAKADLVNFAIQRAQMTGLPIDKFGGAVQTLDNLYLPRLHRKGYVAAQRTVDDNKGSPGGYVMDSKAGIFDNVIVLDFKSLYPSIIRTFFIDPLALAIAGDGIGKEVGDGVVDSAVPGFEGAAFSRTEHILPQLIEELWAQRDVAKEHNNQALSQAIKIIMNSLYGVLGSSKCRFYDHRLASSITMRGHEIIQTSRRVIEKHGYSVIYGDTDSLFVLLGDGKTVAMCNEIGLQLQATLNEFWEQHVQQEYRIKSMLEVEFETHYVKFLMPTVRGTQVSATENSGSKKRYAGMVIDDKGQQKMVYKGLEAVRTDWTLLAREFQRTLYEKIFNGEAFEELVRDTTERLLEGELDEKLVYRKRLRRKLSDYERNVPPHVQAARKSTKKSRWISYVQTVSGPEPVDEATSSIDYQHYVDKQLAPVADGILHFLGASYHSVISAQKELF